MKQSEKQSRQVLAVSKDAVSGSVVTMYTDGSLTICIDGAYQKEGRKNLTAYQGTVGIKGYRVMMTVYGDAETLRQAKAGSVSVPDTTTTAKPESTTKTLVSL